MIQINIKYIITSILLITSICFCDKTSTEIQEDINNKNNELDVLKNEINKFEKLITKKSKEEKVNNEIITQINKKIELTEKLIKRLTDEENYLSKQIYKTKKNIKKQEEELFILKNQLKNRLRYLYKYGKSNLLKQITQSNDWNKKIYRTKYLEILNEYENQIKIRIKKNIDNLKVQKQQLEKEQKSKKNLINEKNKKFDSLENDKKLKSSYLLKIKNQKIKLEQDLISKKDMIEKIEKIIKRLSSDKKETKKREQELAKIRSGKNKSTSGNFAKMKGKLIWPVKGKIIGEFGIHKNQELNIFTENLGIDIQTDTNEQVYSVLDGVILTITNIRDYGDIIILNHGAGYYTVYSNLKNITVYEGQYVDTYTHLAEVAQGTNSNYSNKNIFNFQIWLNQEKLDPEKWIKK
jgi:septal ring factor EnvC (AmiA/AmiB activator)